MILFINTAFDKTVLALKKDKKLFVEEIDEDTKISQKLVEQIDIILKKAGAKKKNIKIIGFNNGPGNFTSLRVSLTFIKAISYYLNIPVVTLNSFQVLALSNLDKSYTNPIIVSIDARMNEIFWVRYRNYSEIISYNENYNLSSESELYEKNNLGNDQLTLVKNNRNILNADKKNQLIFDKIIINNKNNLENIFSFIEYSLSKNLEKNIDKVNLLYLRNDVAKKKHE
jgi:tRNA threonylcarbamoyl adenosine modification protein YeaZ